MIVWGGRHVRRHFFNTGGRYDPATNTWTATSTRHGRPLRARYCHTAVWTGSEMIVWGGANDGPHSSTTGGRYNPATDTLDADDHARARPARAAIHTAVWTGSEMIVWGGYGTRSYLNTGGRYDPAGNTLDGHATVPARPPARATSTRRCGRAAR